MRALRWCVVGVVLLVGCKTSGDRLENPAPPPAFTWIDITFSDDDAFDALLESYLVRSKPAIRINLDTNRPDWSARLNDWMRAFCAGGKVHSPAGRGGPEVVEWLAGASRTPTEARKFLENSLDRIENYTVIAAAWWDNEAKRQKRIDLLRPYTLDAINDPQRDNKYSILLYNGRYGAP